MYKVLTNSAIWESKYPWRTHSEYETYEEAMAVAARLEKNTELFAMVELLDNKIIRVPFNRLELSA